jgi:hypothetical protein
MSNDTTAAEARVAELATVLARIAARVDAALDGALVGADSAHTTPVQRRRKLRLITSTGRVRRTTRRGDLQVVGGAR